MFEGGENEMKVTLKAARINVNLSQSEAAKELKISKDTLGNWEKGKTFPKTSYIPAIEALYKIKYNDIIFLPSNYA